MKPALLLIDVQNRFFETSPTTAESLTQAIHGINEAIELFREKELPIICIQNVNVTDNSDGCKSGRSLSSRSSVSRT